MEHCSVCRRHLALEDRVVLGALGRPLGSAHRSCAVLVQGGAATVARVALAAGMLAFRQKSPGLFKVFEGFRLALRESRSVAAVSPGGSTPGGAP